MKDILELVEQKAEPLNSWDAYAILLRYLNEAYHRVLLRGLSNSDIDAALTVELEHVAVMVASIFLVEGFEELESYLLTAST